MATKYYQLTDKTDAFAQDGFFRFRIGFEKTADGVKTIHNQRKCPTLEIPNPGGVFSTSNVMAQQFIENFVTPTRSRRNGESRPSGPAFTDVTDSPPPVDVDLDPIFDGV